MLPYIYTKAGEIPTFNLCVIAGILVMLITIHIGLHTIENRENEESFIFPVIVISGLWGYFMGAAADVIVNITVRKAPVFSGVSLYEGLIGAIIALKIILKIKKGKTRLSPNRWFDIITPGVVLFHFFGRIGCFFGGCCYGIPTESPLGMCFPDNAEKGIIHNGIKVFPTQLMEAVLVLMIFLLLFLVKNKFKMYLLTYAVGRFFIEFLRADNSGVLLLSQAQIISLIIIVILVFSLKNRQKELFVKLFKNIIKTYFKLFLL